MSSNLISSFLISSILFISFLETTASLEKKYTPNKIAENTRNIDK